MALKKQFLIDLGVEESAASAIMAEHGKMQTTYLTQIDNLTAQLAEQTKTAEEAAAAAETAHKTEVETLTSKNTAQIASLTLANRTSKLVEAAKAFDSDLVLGLIDVTDMDVNDKNFDKEFNKRLDAVKKDKPFLFDAEPATEGEGEQGEGEGQQTQTQTQGATTVPNLQGFVPAQGAGQQAGAKQVEFVRTGAESLPAISSIFNFDAAPAAKDGAAAAA